jgi:hypothetical protein
MTGKPQFSIYGIFHVPVYTSGPVITKVGEVLIKGVWGLCVEVSFSEVA